eukprot:1980580-Amphidinium_carterae.1
MPERAECTSKDMHHERIGRVVSGGVNSAATVMQQNTNALRILTRKVIQMQKEAVEVKETNGLLQLCEARQRYMLNDMRVSLENASQPMLTSADFTGTDTLEQMVFAAAQS